MYAKHYDTKPLAGTTSGNPFPEGTGGSRSFRIPALITLFDGTLVAAADARWNTTYDGGCHDTVVSISKDGGASWRYSFVNYFGDNGNHYDGKRSTSFIDPCLVTDGKRIFLLTDLNPYGVALNGDGNTPPNKNTGFDEKGRLLLSDDSHKSYAYFLDPETHSIVHGTTGEVVSEYKVDSHFNIFGKDVSSNLFFEDSPFKVERTSFLYLISSENGGETWSSPSLLNLKNTEELALLISPGRGLFTSSGLLLFPAYSFTYEEEHTCLLYSADHGKTFHRTKNAPPLHSSESAAIELRPGLLRVFYRHKTDPFLSYVDVSCDQTKRYPSFFWKTPVRTEIRVNAHTELSAIVCRKKGEPRPLLLLSAPMGPSHGEGSVNSRGGSAPAGGERLNGRIFKAFLNADDEFSMEWLPPFSVSEEDEEFQYSCLSTTSDGKIALLYENFSSGWGAGEEFYAAMTFDCFTIDQIFHR